MKKTTSDIWVTYKDVEIPVRLGFIARPMNRDDPFDSRRLFVVSLTANLSYGLHGVNRKDVKVAVVVREGGWKSESQILSFANTLHSQELTTLEGIRLIEEGLLNTIIHRLEKQNDQN